MEVSYPLVHPRPCAMEASYPVVGEGDVAGRVRRSGSVRRLKEYSCVRRLRHRRLLAFLSRQGFDNAFRMLIHETDEHFSVRHMRELVEEGQWDDALRYLSRFLPPKSAPRSLYAHVLYHFVRNHAIFARIVAGDKPTIEALTDKYGCCFLGYGCSMSNGGVRIRCMTLSILYWQQVRASLDWDRVRSVAAKMVDQMALLTPELGQLTRLPERCMKPHHVLPLGFGSRRMRHVKTQGPRPSPCDVADAFLERKLWRIARKTPKSEYTVGFPAKAADMLAVKLDESLSSSRRSEIYDELLLRQFPHLNKGAPATSTLHTNIGTVADSGKNSGVSSLTNGGASSAPTLHTNLAMLADITKKPGVSSLINGGAPVTPISQTMELTSCSENGMSSLTNAEGAPVALISESITLACHAKNTGILSMTNADSPASGNMSQHVKNSGVSSSTSASSKQCQEGCRNESPIQKNICFFEQKCVDQARGFDPKRKRKTEKFTRTTMATVLETEAEETNTEAEDRLESAV